MNARPDRPRSVAGAVTVLLLAAAGASANPESEALRHRGNLALYNLDRDRAVKLFREAVVADPKDGAAYRALGTALWMAVTFARGTMTVDSFLGPVSRSNVDLPPPPAEIESEFSRAVERAIMLARQRVRASPMDPDAHYELGAAVGLRASYMATVTGRVRAAFGSAREAFNEHEKVMDLQATRHDAGLIVGTYRYLVASLVLPVRWAAYIAGFGGDKDRGIELVERAAAYPGDSQTDARLALVLLYNREGRYDEALEQLTALRSQYPRNRLLWLESGATALRSGDHAAAGRFLDDGLERFESDPRPRMFGEDAQWRYKRGAARAALGQRRGAQQDLERAMTMAGPAWLHGRIQFELGKLHLAAGRRDLAEGALRRSTELADRGRDPAVGAEAKRLLRQLR